MNDPQPQAAGAGNADDDAWFRRLREAMRPSPAGKLADFEIIEEIGAGGQGRVFKARQPGTGRTVALKRLREGSTASSEAVARFRREVELAASLRHPGIVTIHGLVEDVLVMEWVDGEPIDAWADRVRADEGGVRRILGASRGMVEAIAAAHGHGVLHRDLKPSNILVDSEDRARVLDFGLARGLHGDDATLTREGGFAGTPAYAAPEQLEGSSRDLDVRADVYSLGAILYRLLTGTPPFATDEGLTALVDAVRAGRVERPSARQGALDAEIDAIVLKAMASDRERRYATAAALAEDVGRRLDGRAVLAHPPGMVYEARKFVRRHRWAVGAGGVALLAIAGGAIASGVLAIRLGRRGERLEATLESARQERDRANREVIKQQAARAFLTELLGDLRTDPADGNAAPGVREALDRRAARLDQSRVRLEPDIEAMVRASIGELYRWLKAPKEAAPYLERAAELLENSGAPASERAVLLSLLGQTYIECGRAGDALTSLTRAVELTQGSADDAGMRDVAQFYLARALVELGRLSEAESELVGIDPTSAFYRKAAEELRGEIRRRRQGR